MVCVLFRWTAPARVASSHARSLPSSCAYERGLDIGASIARARALFLGGRARRRSHSIIRIS